MRIKKGNFVIKEMYLKLSKNSYDVAIVFTLLFLSVSFVVSNDLISSAATIGLWFFVLFAIILIGGLRINSNLMIATISLLVLMLFTTLIQGEELVVFIKIAFSIFVISLFVATTSFERFSIAYVKVMKFLCIASLVGYGLHLIIPSVFDRFIVQNTVGVSYSNYVIYVQWVSSGQNAFRNWGFAWEPGAFSTFVCLAMLLDVLFVSKRVKLRTVILYVLTVITTFSTTGIIAILCLCLFLAVTNKTVSKGTKRAIILVLILSILLMIALSSVLFDLNTNSTFGKIINFLNADDRSNLKSTSTSIRYFSITKVFSAFLHSPLYGWGYDGLIEQTLEFTHGMNTCTFVNWFAVYGVAFGFIMLIGIVRFARLMSGNKLYRFIIVVFLFGITMTENYIHCPMIYILVLYGYLTNNTYEKAATQINTISG